MFQLQISVRKADGSGILQESQSNSDGKSRHQETIFIQKQERPKQVILYVLTLSLHNSKSKSSKISNEESKRQYVGNGLWENGDRQYSKEPAKFPTVTTPKTPSFHEKKMQVNGLNLATHLKNLVQVLV